MGSLDKFTHNNAYRAKCKARHVAALRSAALRQRQVDIHPTAETPVESLEGSREDQGGQAKGGGTAKGGGVAEDGGPAGEIESLLRQLAVRVVAQLKQVRALRGVVEAWGVALITGRLRSTS